MSNVIEWLEAVAAGNFYVVKHKQVGLCYNVARLTHIGVSYHPDYHLFCRALHVYSKVMRVNGAYPIGEYVPYEGNRYAGEEGERRRELARCLALIMRELSYDHE